MKVLLRTGAFLIAVFLAGCVGDTTPEVKFTLSNWFNGNLVDVRLDVENGIEIPFQAGRYDIEVPASGIVYLRSLELLTKPHRETVAYEGGSPVPLPFVNETELNQDRKYWWSIGRESFRSDGEEKTTRLIYRIATPAEDAPDDVFAVADAL